MLRRRARDQEPLALLVGRGEHEIPIDLARRRGEQVLAAHERAGVERHALAVAREERLQRLGHGAAQQALQRRALAEDARGRQQVLGALAHAFASGGHRELDAREPLGFGEAAQRADAKMDIEATASATSRPVASASRPARPGRIDRARAAGPTAAVGLVGLLEALQCGHARRRRAPNASTTVLRTNVSNASNINSEATANAPTRSYSS